MRKRTVISAGVILVGALALTGCSADNQSLTSYIPTSGAVTFNLNGYDKYLEKEGWTVPKQEEQSENNFVATKADLGCNVLITTVENSLQLEKNEKDDYLSKKLLYENAAQLVTQQNPDEPQKNALPEAEVKQVASNRGPVEVYMMSYKTPVMGQSEEEGSEIPSLPSGKITGTADTKTIARFFNTNYENDEGYKTGSGYYATMSCAEGLLKDANWNELLKTVELNFKD